MKLSKRQREILTFMVDPPEDGDGALVSEDGQWWFGLKKTSWRAVRPLIQTSLIKLEDEAECGFQRWVATEEAARVLADPVYEPMAIRAQRLGRPVSSDPTAGRTACEGAQAVSKHERTVLDLHHLKWLQWVPQTRQEPIAYAVDPDSMRKHGHLRAINGSIVPSYAKPAKKGTKRDETCTAIIARLSSGGHTRTFVAKVRK